MDAFSDILSGVKLNGAVYFNAEFTDPWGVSAPPSLELAPALAPGSPHLVIYHFIVEGSGYCSLLDGTCVAFQSGDIVVLPHGDPHSLSSDAKHTSYRENPQVLDKIKKRDLSLLRAGGDGGSKTRLVCGFMACDPQLSRPILSGLPHIFKVNVRNGNNGQWLESSILHLVEEAASGMVGSEALLAKISEALFVDTLRRYIAELPAEQTGWLAGARDHYVGRSLGLLQSRASEPWTIAALAREVGLSRSALVERFTRYLSEPPMTYLTRWRMQMAARVLTRTSKGVAEIALEVGYESEAAFNRAFKREFGLPPARYRRERKPLSAASSAS